MWLYLIPSMISLFSLNVVLSILIPKFKKREEEKNAQATANSKVFPDIRLKIIFICLLVFCWAFGMILFFVPKLCELMEFDWLITNVVWWSVILLDTIVLTYCYQILMVEYNNDYIFITNIFRKTTKIRYSEIDRVTVSLNLKIFYKGKTLFIPNMYYGVDALKNEIVEHTKDYKN